MFMAGFDSVQEIYEHTFTPINRFYLVVKVYQCKSNINYSQNQWLWTYLSVNFQF